MNKLFKSLVCLALILSTLFALASCGKKPSLDFDEVEDNLEDEDYIVVHTDDEDDLFPGTVEYLYAEDDDNYLCITEYASSKLASLAYAELKLNNEKTIANYEHRLELLKNELKQLEYCLKNHADDSDYYDEDYLEDRIDEIEDQIEDTEEDLEDYKKEYFFNKSGKKVWYGTADAIDDANGK